MGNPLLTAPGAVALDDRAVAAHYGAPLPEQRALAEGRAFVDLSDSGVVTVSGSDRLTWLNSFTSQLLTGLRAGDSVETLLLDPNGRIEQAIRLVEDGDQCWLIVDPGAVEALEAFLLKMRFALRVEVANVSDQYAVLMTAGHGQAIGALRGLEMTVVEWHDPWQQVQPGGTQYAVGEHPAQGWSAVYSVMPRAAREDVTQLVRDGRVAAAGTLALRALEIHAWRPRFGDDVDARALPHEFDWLRSAVHLTKGCYRGQETVAKVHNLGHPPRRLVLLHLDGSEGSLPADGALVYRSGASAQEGERPVGRVTRAALHYEWGPIALALLKRSVPEDAPLEVVGTDTDGAIAANPQVIVPSTAGATRDIPRLKRI